MKMHFDWISSFFSDFQSTPHVAMENILKAFDPTFNVLKILGFFPFKIESEEIKISKIKIFYSLFIDLVLFYWLKIRITNDENFNIVGSPLSKITIVITDGFLVIFCNLVSIFFIFNRWKIFKLLKTFARLNEKVRKNWILLSTLTVWYFDS